jgi:hypothetical protein
MKLMCRSKELGGRRCPAHTDPQKIAAYNTVRRQRYAAQKQINGEDRPDETFVLKADEEYGFSPFKENRATFLLDSVEGQQWLKDADMFAEAVGATEEGANLKPWQYRVDMQTSLRAYTQYEYSNIKSYLHGQNMNGNLETIEPVPMEDDQVKYTVEKMHLIDEALEHAAAPESERALYRGMRVPNWVDSDQIKPWIHENFPVGGVVSQKSFMSTSMNPTLTVGMFSVAKTPNGRDSKDSDRSVVIEIMSKQGAPLGELLSEHGNDETEILMPRDAKFRVVSVHEDVRYLSMKQSHYEMSGIKRPRHTRTVVRLIDAS